MDVEVNRIVKTRKPKIKTILRTRGFYGVPDLIRQCKSHIWPIVEGTCGAISHASDTHLRRIDDMQRLFTRDLGLSEEAAFLEHNFAPTQLRRHIAVLGIIFKSCIGHAHLELMKLFPAVPVLDYHTHHVLRKAPVHNWQVHDFC